MAVMISGNKKDLFATCKYGMFGTLKNKIKKICAIIRNKDYYYSDVVMSKEDFKQFKSWVNQF